MIYRKIKHAIHPEHALELEHKGEPYKCDGCHQVGFGARYTCKERCNVHLHKDCAEPRPTITHPFFPSCRFKFLESGHDGKRCDACGEDIKGYVYHCFGKECRMYGGFDLHPSCANLERELQTDSMKLKLQKKVSSQCYSCGNKVLEPGVRSWSYVSTDRRCHLHVSCVKKMLLENWGTKFLGGGGGDDMALEICDPKLQIALPDDRKKSGKYAKLKQIIKIVITVIIATIVGDPTSMVVGLVSGLITH